MGNSFLPKRAMVTPIFIFVRMSSGEPVFTPLKWSLNMVWLSSIPNFSLSLNL